MFLYKVFLPFRNFVALPVSFVLSTWFSFHGRNGALIMVHKHCQKGKVGGNHHANIWLEMEGSSCLFELTTVENEGKVILPQISL